MVGILFAHPAHQIVKNEILPFLTQMDIRSGDYIDFYFAGYIEKNEVKKHKDSILIKQKISQKHIYFSESLFLKMRKDIEKDTRWKHSGGVDFLLIDVIRIDSPRLDFSNCIETELSIARENKVLPTLSIFFESIFKYAQENENKITQFSDQQIPSLAISTFAKLLDKSLFSLYERGKIYAIKNLAK